MGLFIGIFNGNFSSSPQLWVGKDHDVRIFQFTYENSLSAPAKNMFFYIGIPINPVNREKIGNLLYIDNDKVASLLIITVSSLY